MVDYLIQTKVKGLIKEKGLNTAGDSLEALEQAFLKILNGAMERAKENGRKTLMARDC